MARPLTMKKDGIQTRNRKLSAKSKKKRGTVMDFFASPFDTKPFGFSSHMGGMSGHIGNPMSSYYGASMSSMGLGTNFGMGSMYTGQTGGHGMSPMSSISQMQMSAAGLTSSGGGMSGGLSHMSNYPTSPSPLSAAMQHSVIGAMT